MRKSIPFKKTIEFNTSFDKITNINIEHDYKIFVDEISGSFNLYGNLRKTEASLVDEDFKYDIPFEIALSEEVDLDTVSLKIMDFDYNILDNNSISIDVDLELDYEEKESDRKLNLDSILNSLEMNEKEEVIEEEPKEEIVTLEEEDIPDVDINNEVNVEINNEVKEVNENIISSFVSDKKDYVTYKVYVANEYEDMNTISNKFNIPINTLLEYNDEKEVNVGDKIIIPYVFE